MSASCTHLKEIGRFSAPKLSDAVHREECTQCFDGQDGPDGIDVCLSCFNGGCSAQRHAKNHVQKSAHKWTLNIKRIQKPKATRGDEEPPTKITKLAIAEERDEDNYDYVTTLRCWQCSPDGNLLPVAQSNPQLKAIIDGIMQSMSSARQSEVQAWEEEINPCEHALLVEQVPNPSLDLTQCSSSGCGLKQNLWLCLTCGNLGCGRALYGGLGGNGHALAHYEATNHPVTVKLGTITPEGHADLHCYQCDEATLDPNLAEHLATFGINVLTQTKTEKSMTELQIEHNLKYDFSLTTEDGKALEPVFGEGLTGLANLGNSCYMASVLQTLFSLPSFQNRYFRDNYASKHFTSCTEPLPAECLECQMCKVADGLLSGRYSKPASGGTTPSAETNKSSQTQIPVFQAGIRPSTFKALVGKGHVEFSTMKQQDAEEFLGWLVTALRREQKRRGGEDATSVLSYSTEQRVQCLNCKRVRYKIDGPVEVLGVGIDAVPLPASENAMDVDDTKDKMSYKPVNLVDAISSQILGNEVLEAYQCESCAKHVEAVKQHKFASFPQVLVVQVKKFQLVNWVPTKLDVPVNLPSTDTLEFTEHYLGKGLQPDEEVMSDSPPQLKLPEFNQGALSLLQSMGFPLIRCQKALLATGNTDNSEVAMEWLFNHMEDPTIDEPIKPSDVPGAAPASSTASEEQIGMLVEMGFTSSQARKALIETQGNAERAVEWLFSHPDDPGMEEGAPSSEEASASSSAAATDKYGSTDVPVRYRLKAFISHKGPSVHSGHYVAHIQVGEQWVLFNDEKVVKADDESVKELKRLAYLYVFEKV